MADYLFVPQTVLDRWSEQGKVQVDGHVLTLLGENKVFALTAAVRFLKMEAGEDAMGLIHKVKTIDALKQMSAEHYLDSVILGDNAYEVQQGFLADANAIRAAAAHESSPGKAAHPISASSMGVPVKSSAATKAAPANPQAPKPPAASANTPAAAPKPAGSPKPAAKPGESGEPDLIAQFLLDNLQ